MNTTEPASVLCVATDNAFVDGVKLLLDGSSINQVQSVSDLDDVLAAMTSGAVNLLLIKDDFPKLDAVTLCKTVRTSPDSPNIRVPIVLICTDRNLQRTVDASNAGANEVLLYPFTESKLSTRLWAAYHDHREFIECEFYVGPDRRSLRNSNYGGTLRRAEDVKAAEEPQDVESPDVLVSDERVVATAAPGPYERSLMERAKYSDG